MLICVLRVARSLAHCILLILKPCPVYTRACTPSAALSRYRPSKVQPHQCVTPEIHSSDCSHTLPRHRVQRRPRCLVPSPAHPPASLDSPSPLSQHAWRSQARIPPKASNPSSLYSLPLIPPIPIPPPSRSRSKTMPPSQNIPLSKLESSLFLASPSVRSPYPLSRPVLQPDPHPTCSDCLP